LHCSDFYYYVWRMFCVLVLSPSCVEQTTTTITTYWPLLLYFVYVIGVRRPTIRADRYGDRFITYYLVINCMNNWIGMIHRHGIRQIVRQYTAYRNPLGHDVEVVRPYYYVYSQWTERYLQNISIDYNIYLIALIIIAYYFIINANRYRWQYIM